MKSEPVLIYLARCGMGLALMPVLLFYCFLAAVLFWVFGIPSQPPPWLRYLVDWVAPENDSA